jgi:predicted NBD/HSP70 family sugar kinase
MPAAVDGHGSVHRAVDLGVPAGTVIRDAIAAAFCVPVAVDNDANLAALGEYVRGAGRGTRDFILLTLGTNIGMGAIVDGQIFRGATGGAGEAGLLLVPVETVDSPPMSNGRRVVRSGRFGAGLSRAPAGYAWIEELVGGGALATAAATTTGEGPLPGRTPGARPGNRSERVFKSAAAGDSRALELIEAAIEGWAYTIANVVAVLDPDAIALSGGLVPDLGPFLDRLRERVADLSRVSPRIVIAELGAVAGLFGAEIAAQRAAAAAGKDTT